MPKKPILRKEIYLNAILTGVTDDLPAPITREEKYYYDIAIRVSSLEKQAKDYTDTQIALLPKGVVLRGEVDYYNDLPQSPEYGDAYTVKYQGSSGTVADGREFAWATSNTWIEIGVSYTAGANVSIVGNQISAIDTTYESKTAAQGGTAVSLVTTGEKYTWNNKQNALTAQTAYTAKGSATKVPQITTNALGQVTNISEVNITDNNTWRAVKVNGTEKLSNLTSGNALDLTAGSNVTLSENNGVVTIAATDTTYESKSASSGGTAVSLVTTGEKYDWNNKQAKITASGLLKGNGSGTISAATAGTDYVIPSAVVTQASIDANGLITYKNSSGTSLFTLQLPLYTGGVS